MAIYRERWHGNRWIDWAIKLATACAAVITTAKVIIWLIRPMVVEAQDAIIRPAMVRIEVHESEDRVYQAQEREANLAIIEMLALPPGSPKRQKIANAFRKIAVVDSLAPLEIRPAH